jgi:hypothetical protein
MALAKLNPLFVELHGKIGDIVFRRGPNGQTIISKMPRRSLWKVQKVRKAQKKRLTEAHARARTAMADPLTRAYYDQEAKKTGKRAYSLALTHFLQNQS